MAAVIKDSTNVTATASPGTNVFSGGASVIEVTNNSATLDMYVNVVGVHATDYWYPIGPGLTKPFHAKQNGITSVYAYIATAATCRVLVNAANVLQ